MRRMEAEQTDQDHARVPFRTVLLSIVGLWLCYFVLTTLRGELVDLGFTFEATWRRALSSIAGVVITVGLWLILRLFDGRAMWIKIGAALLLSLPVALLIAQANQMVFASMEERVFARSAEQRGFTVHRDQSGDLLVDIPARAMPGAPIDAPIDASVSAGNGPQDIVTVPAARLQGTYWQEVVEVAYGRYFMMLAWCALYLALLTGEKARAAERREGTYRRAAKAAELRSLRYQVNPHFLFNTLNSLSALVLTGRTEAAERMIQMISTFYRRSLADDPTSDVPLADEIALQKLYLDIEGVRFPLRLVAEYDVPPDLEDVLVPGMILQPLVENSVKHAVAPSGDQVKVTISAVEDYGRLVLSVSDNGTPADTGGPARDGFGIGLTNVRERLAARFGKEATVVSGPVPGGYATHLRLPITHGIHKREAAQ
ncbi:histidine kinase [Altererythrobacter sp. KTW20L]|uniref:sensor histidine kinase n=1 Tax=Altererythrobacter sp. KTW20L TaxID=2942210 RepID=UPI0020BEB686|nr:histidine kinase [Altererythrobacter sp. KTW20L]MCL6249975.1 histidine kinase [Altererythrobacter sp. KTW20L]